MYRAKACGSENGSIVRLPTERSERKFERDVDVAKRYLHRAAGKPSTAAPPFSDQTHPWSRSPATIRRIILGWVSNRLPRMFASRRWLTSASAEFLASAPMSPEVLEVRGCGSQCLASTIGQRTCGHGSKRKESAPMECQRNSNETQQINPTPVRTLPGRRSLGPAPDPPSCGGTAHSQFQTKVAAAFGGVAYLKVLRIATRPTLSCMKSHLE